MNQQGRDALNAAYWKQRMEKTLHPEGTRIVCLARLRYLPHPDPTIHREPLQRFVERFVGEYRGPGMCHIGLLDLDTGKKKLTEYHSVIDTRTGEHRKVLAEDIKPLRWDGEHDTQD